MADDLEQATPKNDGQADYGSAGNEEKDGKKVPPHKEKIEAMEADNFDAPDYQEDGQGGPRQGLEKEERD